MQSRAFLLSPLLALVLAACGGGGSDPNAATTVGATSDGLEQALAVAPGTVGADASGNVSYDFESDFGGAAPGWYVNWWGTPRAEARREMRPGYVHAGGSAQRFRVDAAPTGSGAHLVYQYPFVKDRAYTASVWLRADSSAEVEVQLRRDMRPYNLFASQRVTVGTSWQRVDLAGTYAWTDVGSLRVVAHTLGVNVYVDDMAITSAQPAVDTKAPTVNLAASATSVTGAGTLTLTAQASDDVAVKSIEFYDGDVKLASSGNVATVAIDEGDNGVHNFTAVARDTADNSAISSAVPVSVSIATAAASTRQLKKSYRSLDGTTNVWYWEYLPPGYATSTKTYPLLVFFHGYGENGAADGSQLDLVKRHGPPKLIAANNPMCFDTAEGNQCFIVVSPQNGRGDGWDARDSVAMLEHALATYRVDRTRVYVTGLSNGGAATWDLTTRKATTTTYWAGEIAAAAPICGANYSRWNHDGICNGIASKKLPVWTFHGDADPIVPLYYTKSWVDKANKVSTADGYNCDTAASPSTKLTVYPGVGHDSWTRTYDPANEVEPGKNLYQWLLAHRRS